MEILIEFLAELIIEVFGEIGVYVLGKFFNMNLHDSRALKITKYVIYTIVFLIEMTLLIIAIFNKRGIIIVTVIAFLILNLLVMYLRYIIPNKKTKSILLIIGTIIRYALAITLIVLASLYLENNASKICLIILSIISIIIFIFVDSFRIYKHSYEKRRI